MLSAAGPRSSADYVLRAESVDGAGGRATSIHYTLDASLGGPAGVSTAASASLETARAGYIAGLYEIVGFQLAAAAPTVSEASSRQLAGAQLLDDATTLAVPAEAIVWTVGDGPLAGIDAGGLATADLVYEDTPATARGLHGGRTATLDLIVLDTSPDNFGSYAGDGLSDGWQLRYFGPDNPNAAPVLDPDADGQDNLFEFTAGLVPTDPASHFVVSIGTPPDQVSQRLIAFGPCLAGRSYTVMTSTNLADWGELGGPVASDDGTTRTVTDPEVGAPARFYRVKIVKL
jgi:hypothetical protein